MALTREIRPDYFPIVCVGGSAGGLQAYTRLLRHLPNNMGVAVVIVNHLRTVETMLPQILPHYTSMPVAIVTEGMRIKPNQVFIIPEKRDLHVLDGRFRLKPISKPRGWPDVITVCLVSLTRHWEGQLIAVIVSGLSLIHISSSSPGGISSEPPVQDAPRDRAKTCVARSPGRVKANTLRFCQDAT